MFEFETSRTLADEVLVLGRLHVLAKVDRAQVERCRVALVGILSARERVVHAARGRRDLPRQEPRGDGHDRVEVARLELSGVAREGEHARVLGAEVVREAQPLHHVRRRLGERPGAVGVGVVLGKPLRVAARHVAGARDVAHDEHVLRLGDDGLEVAPAHKRAQVRHTQKNA